MEGPPMLWIIFSILAVLILIDKLRSFHLRLGPVELNFGFGKSRLWNTQATFDSNEKKQLND